MPNATITNTFRKLRIKLNLPKGTRFHSFRPTNATILAEHDINPKKIQIWLGHSSAAFSLERYVHATRTMQAGINEALEDAKAIYTNIN